MTTQPFVFELKSGPRKSTTMNAYDWKNAWGGQSREDLDEHGAYQAVSWVRRCLEMRANAVSTLPTHVYRGEAEVEWDFADALPRFLWMTEASLQLYGAAYWMRERNTVRDTGYAWLNPKQVKIRYDVEDGLIGFEHHVQGRVQELTPKQVLYFWMPHLNAEIGPGTGWVSTILTPAGISQAANTFADAFFERGAIPAVLLSIEGNASEDELKRLEAWWKRMLAGVKHAWNTVAVKAIVKPVVIGYPTKDLAMPELMGVVRQQIAVAAGVPQTMLEDAANYATAVEHRQSFYSETIVPEAMQIESALNAQLFEPQGLTLDLAHEELDIFQEDEAQRSQSLQHMTTAGVPLDMAMEMLGFELPGNMTYDQLRARLEEEKQANAERAAALVKPQAGPSAEEEGQPEELRKWQRKAMRSLRAGKGAGVDFVSDAIGEDTKRIIGERLGKAATEEAVKAAFDLGGKVKPDDAELADVPTRVTITEEDIAKAFAEWDRVMPSEFRGLLDAQVEERA